MEGNNILIQELVINLILVCRGEPVLGLVVPVPEIVAVAGLVEGPAPRVLGRVGAAVRVPVERGRVLDVAVLDEGVERVREETCVRDGVLATFKRGGGAGYGQAGDEGQEAGYGGEFHLDGRDRMGMGIKRLREDGCVEVESRGL